MEKVMQDALSLAAVQRLDREDRVETGIKPNARVRNDGVLELRGGSRVNEGAGYVWEGEPMWTYVHMGMEDRG